MRTSVLAIHASERARGNTGALFERAVKGAEDAGAEVETLIVRDRNFSPCTSCGGCEETGECVLKDDMTDIYRLLRQTDHILVASPIYFWSLPGRFKCMIDRCQTFWRTKFVLKQRVAANPSGIKRVGAFISCCGLPKGDVMFPPAEKTIKAFFNCLDVELKYTLYSSGMDAPTSILERTDVLERAYETGAALAGETTSSRDCEVPGANNSGLS